MALFALLLLAPWARATVYTEASLTRMLREIAPEVEKVAGRSFRALPVLVIDDRAHAKERMKADELPVARFYGIHDDPAALAAAEALVDHSLAVYSSIGETVYVLSDGMRAIFQRSGRSEAGNEQLLREALAHELAHALEDQQADREGMFAGGRGDAGRALSEGFAEWVADRVGAHVRGETLDVDARLAQAISGDPADPDVFAYGYGNAYVTAYQARYGTEGLWWLLGHAVPSREQILGAARASTSAPRFDDTVVGHWLDPLTSAGTWTTRGGLFEPALLIQAVPAASVAGGAFGRGQRGTSGTRAAMVVAVSFPTPEAASAAMASRVSDLRQRGTTWRFLAEVRSGLLSPPRVTRGDRAVRGLGVDEAWQVSVVTQSLPIGEVWVRQGSLLVGYGWSEITRPELPTVLAAVLRDPGVVRVDEATRTAELDAALREPAPPAELGPVPLESWAWRMRQALVGLAKGDPADCVRRVEAAFAGAPTPGKVRLASTALLCADAIGAADSVRGLFVGASGPEWTGALLGWGDLALRSGDVAEAIRILGVVEPVTPEELAAYGNLAMWVVSESSDASLILRALAEGDGSADARAAAAVTLWRLGRRADARRVLLEACPRVSDVNRASCEAMLREMGR